MTFGRIYCPFSLHIKQMEKLQSSTGPRLHVKVNLRSDSPWRRGQHDGVMHRQGSVSPEARVHLLSPGRRAQPTHSSLRALDFQVSEDPEAVGDRGGWSLINFTTR